MFKPRKIEKYGLIKGVKIYSIVKDGKELEAEVFMERLEETWDKVYDEDPIGFGIFHEGNIKYLVLVRWGNDNEIFPYVSIFKDGKWIEDMANYSFCLWDLEVFWNERNSYIKHVYSDSPDIEEYRNDFVV